MWRTGTQLDGDVIRPVGWNAANDVPASWTRPGYLYRGITEDEFRFIETHGVIRSTEQWSAPGEGTNFAEDADEAESYVNFGRTDPRKTGKPTYVIEVKKDARFKRWPDGYWKAREVPASAITRVWAMIDEEGAVVAYEIAPDAPRINAQLDPYRNAGSDIEDAYEYIEEMIDRRPDLRMTRTRMPLEEILTWGDYSSWGEWDQGELLELTRDELFDEFSSFRGERWAHQALRWLDDGVPAIVLAEFEEEADVADGRGRVSFAVGFDMQELPVIVLSEEV